MDQSGFGIKLDKNVGGIDRNFRIVAGFVLMVFSILSIAGIIASGSGIFLTAMRIVVLVIGIVLAVTGITCTCPFNSFIGINTRDNR